MVFSVFFKTFKFGVYEAYLKNRMNHTSHLKISAKNTLFLAFIFRSSLNPPLLAFFSPLFSLYLLYSLLYLHICRSIEETLQILITSGFFLN
jgi:hypothetical protein